MGKKYQAFKDAVVNVRSGLRELMPAFITAGRVVAVLYLILIAVLAGWVVPGRNSGKHYLARRYMGANTRLSAELLLEPTDLSLEDRLWLKRERAGLVDMYLKESVGQGCPVTADKVKTWPDIPAKGAVAVELAAQPDWVFLNQGSAVQLWVGNDTPPERSHVLAVVPSSGKWLAFVCKHELRQQGGLINSKEAPTLRLDAAPEKPADGSNECQAPPPGAAPAKPGAPEAKDCKRTGQ
jgi:hypothetical protein